uniref:Cuticle protein n=1 Tax=Cacopsylla melanoneura TaxID=428564 RepID=A0A8D9EWS3_9HEMI
MKFFIAFLATLACAVATPSAYSAYSPAPATYYGDYYGSSYAHYPAADIKVLPSGYLADTPEVAHAKVAHEVAKGYAAAAAAANPDYTSYAYPAPVHHYSSHY